MRKAGQIVLFRFPHADLRTGKLRPALLLGRAPGPYDDWLVCMASSQLHQYVDGFDELVREGDVDFGPSGLRMASVIRISRLAVVEGRMLLGSTGEIDTDRLARIKGRLAEWLLAPG